VHRPRAFFQHSSGGLVRSPTFPLQVAKRPLEICFSNNSRVQDSEPQ
jgi:hypothetical protein